MAGAGGSSASSSSEPKDVTPEAFKNLQEPFASVLAQLIGFGPLVAGGTTGATGTTAAPGAAVAPTAGAVPGLTPEQLRFNQQVERDGGTLFQAPTEGSVQKAGDAPRFAPTGDPSDVTRGIPTQDGPVTAPVGGGEQTLLDLLLGRATGTGDAGPAQGLLTDTISGNFLPGEEGSNPFLTSAIEAAQRTSLRGLEDVLSRTLPGRFTQAGQFTQPEGSTAFDREAGRVTTNVAAEISDIAAQLGFAGFESERGRQQEAALGLPGVSETEVNSLITNLQAQALPRLIEQLGLERGTDAFNRQVTNLLQVLAIAQGASQPLVAQESESSSKAANASIG